jgi:phosphatidylserine synthase
MTDIMQWAAPRMCKTKSDFLKGMTFDALTDSIVFAEKPFNYRNELLVLDIFTEQLGKDNESIGIIFTSRKLFRNVALAIMG